MIEYTCAVIVKCMRKQRNKGGKRKRLLRSQCDSYFARIPSLLPSPVISYIILERQNEKREEIMGTKASVRKQKAIIMKQIGKRCVNSKPQLRREREIA